jgi:hypothetical protein
MMPDASAFMYHSRINGKLLVRPRILLIIVLMLTINIQVYGGTTKRSREEVPVELQASDPEVKQLLDTATDNFDIGDLEAAGQLLGKAEELCRSRRLTSDVPIVLAHLASLSISNGNIEKARDLLAQALESAAERSNTVLEAQILVSVASLKEMAGDRPAALLTDKTALEKAESGKSLYVQSRALGEIGRILIGAGSIREARTSINKALDIDKANRYSLEALHRVYLVYSLLAESDRNLPNAIPSLREALQLANATGNTYAGSLAKNALGIALIYQGDSKQGLELLQADVSSKGTAPNSSLLADFSHLEILAAAYQTAHQIEKTIETWNLLFEKSKAASNQYFMAEAAQKLGDIYRDRHESAKAFEYYNLAASSLRMVGNKSGLLQVLSSQQAIAEDAKQSAELPHIYDELLTIVAENKGQVSDNFQFTIYVMSSVYYKKQKDWAKEIDILEKAEAIHSSLPSDKSQNDSFTKMLMEMWIDHAAASSQLREPEVSLLAMEQAFYYASQLKDDKAISLLTTTMLSGARDLGGYKHVQDVCGGTDYNKCLEAALGLCALESFSLAWRDQWKQQIGVASAAIANTVDKLATTTNGLQRLVRLTHFINPAMSGERFRIDVAIARQYLFTANEPKSAIPFLEEANALIESAHTPLDESQAMVYGWWAMALARTGHGEEAEKKLEESLRVAKAIGTQQAQNFAEAASALVRLINKSPAAAEATQYWIKVLGDSADLRRSLALSLAAGKDFDGALREMTTAAAMFEKDGRKAELSQALISTGLYLQFKKQPNFPMAQARLERALALLQELSDENGQAQVELDLGFLHVNESKYPEALGHFEKAQRLADKIGAWEIEGRSLWALGEISERDRKKGSEDLYSRSAEMLSKAGILDAESLVLVKLATIAKTSGRSDDALRLLLRARDLAEKSNSNGASISAYFELGRTYDSIGQYQNGLLAFSSARDKAIAERNLSLQAYAELAIAEVCQLLGEWSLASQNATSALDHFKSLDDERGQLFAYSALMGVYTERTSEMKDFDKAVLLSNEASRLKNFHQNSATINANLLEMYNQTGKYEEGITIARSLLSKCSTEHDDTCIAHAHLSLAESWIAKQQYKAAQSELKAAESLLKVVHDYYLSGRFVYVSAHLARSRGEYDEAVRDYIAIVGMLTELKQQADSEENRALSENYSFIFDELVNVLYLRSQSKKASVVDYASLALQNSELNKAQGFDKVWGSKFSDAIRRRLPSDIREREIDLQHERETTRAELQSVLARPSESNRQVELIRSELKKADDSLDIFVSSLKTKYPTYANARYPGTLDIQHLPLRDGEILVELRVTDDAVYVWLVAKRSQSSEVIQFYSIPKGREWVRAQVRKIRDNISQSQVAGFNGKILEELTGIVFPAAVYSLLRDSKSIIYVPDDAFALLPLEMFSPSAGVAVYPLTSVPTTYYPSAESMVISRQLHSATTWETDLLGIGDPITSQNDPRWEVTTELSTVGASDLVPTKAGEEAARTLRSAGISFYRLPGTAVEVRGIAELIKANGGSPDVRLGIDASRNKFLQTDLRKYRFIHFATHGLLPVDSGLREPALLFSFTGDPLEMFLQLSQILNLQLSSEMVVLSACNTGSGKLSKAEGVYNMGRAFMAAGASSVVVSMWEVDDESTAKFMGQLYRSILSGETKSVALMHARQALIRQGYDQPFYWAPFILMGE